MSSPLERLRYHVSGAIARGEVTAIAAVEARPRAYRNGEEIEYTGETETIHGATFYGFVVVADSHRIGWKGVTSVAPKGA